jgi:hypothetical protein
VYGGSNAASQLRSWGIPAAKPNQGNAGDPLPDWIVLFFILIRILPFLEQNSLIMWLESSTSVMCEKIYLVA